MRLRTSVRQRVVALVAGLSALGGFLAGAAGALLAVAILTPSAPVTAGDKVVMVLSYGAIVGVCGAVLGTVVAFTMLRRVRLGHVFAFSTAGAALGLTFGFLGGPWAWHNFSWLGIGGLLAGALAAWLVGRASSKQIAPGRLAGLGITHADDHPFPAELSEGPMTSLGDATARQAERAISKD